MHRRDSLRSAGAAGAATIGARLGRRFCDAGESQETAAAPLARKLPRWRGFNLLEKFMVHGNKPFVETDFEWMAEWGFDFVRLPMDYRSWTDPGDPYKLNEKVLKEIDEAVEFGRRHGVHVSLNLHRAPGYTVARPPEKLDLWTDEEAQGVGVHVGEWGSYNKTPHHVVLRWMRDFLTLWQEAGWGWALWNLRGSFGILDSGRSDVAYEDFHGHTLDWKMLDLLREF